MNEDITYCTNKNCPVMKCIRNPKHIDKHDIYHSFAHLEDNPLYCKKSNWYGYQVEGVDLAKEN